MQNVSQSHAPQVMTQHLDAYGAAQAKPARPGGADAFEPTRGVERTYAFALATPEFAVANARRLGAPVSAVLQPPVLHLAYQDMVMRCIDRHAPPGYLTIDVIRDVLDVPLGEAMVVFACAGDAWRKQRVKHMPDVLKALDRACVPKKVMARQLLWAVHMDDVRRGTIWRDIKCKQSELRALEACKKSVLPWGKSSAYINKWLASDPNIAWLRQHIEQARHDLHVLPSEYAQQMADTPSVGDAHLIDM